MEIIGLKGSVFVFPKFIFRMIQLKFLFLNVLVDFCLRM